MATYKVIQDIEAEDKFIGPLTLKQFVFAAIGTVFSYLCFFVIVRGLWPVAIVFAPVTLFGFFMAIPWSKDQPTDLWVLAKIRFKIKPKTRVWDQAGKQDLVTITAPKRIEKVFTKDLSETEVQSRLKTLADTMNTRGWAVKHVGLSNVTRTDEAADRLLPTPIPVGSRAPLDNEASDILENTQVDVLINESEKTRKADLQNKIEQARNMAKAVEQQEQKVVPEDDTYSLSEELKQRKKVGSLSTSKMQRFQPKAQTNKSDAVKKANKTEKTVKKTDADKTISEVTEPLRPDIISLAHNNDLNVATLARQAKKDDESQEVVVSLH